MKINKILLGVLVFLILALTVYAVPPTISGVSLTPAVANTTVDLSLNAICTDSDNSTLTAEYVIYKNDVSQTSGSNSVSSGVNTLITTVDDTLTAKGEVWKGSVRCFDGANYTLWTNTTVTILNSPPTVTPGTITINSDEDEASITISASDPDGEIPTPTSATSENSSRAECSISGNTLTASRGSDESWDGVTHCTVEVKDSSNAIASAVFSINVNMKSMLDINKVEVFVEDNSDRLDDRDTFNAKPDESLKFEITVKNLYSGDTDEEEVDIQDEITITVKDWDDDGDESWDSDSFDINYDDEEIVTVDLGTIPTEIEEGKHDVIIEVKGEDENNNNHEVTWTVFLDVEKEREDIRISSFSMEPSTISCERDSVLRVKVTNSGSKKSNKIVFEAKQTTLGISIQDYDIDLNDGDSKSLEYPLHIMSDVAPGTYSIRLNTYFDMDNFDDQDVSNTGSVNLIVQKCVSGEGEAEAEAEAEAEGEVIVVPPSEGGVVIPVEEEEKPLLSLDNVYLVGLVLVNVLLILGIVFLIVKLVTRK